MEASEARILVKEHSYYVNTYDTELDRVIRQIECHANFGLTSFRSLAANEDVLKELEKLGYTVEYHNEFDLISW